VITANGARCALAKSQDGKWVCKYDLREWPGYFIPERVQIQEAVCLSQGSEPHLVNILPVLQKGRVAFDESS
jgi:hypothetical protein